MLNSSVGEKGVNLPRDVNIIQQIINLRGDLRKPLPKLKVDGKYGSETKAAIDKIQSTFMSKPDGRISPFGRTINKLWLVEYANPTGHGLRSKDSYGSGHHGAPRGHRKHDGADYEAIPGQQVKSPMSGIISKISKPYTSGIDAFVLSGVEVIASNGNKCWVWYMQPSVNIVGKIVKAGDSIVGKAKTLKNRYKEGITDHVHVRIHKQSGAKIDPISVIK